MAPTAAATILTDSGRQLLDRHMDMGHCSCEYSIEAAERPSEKAPTAEHPEFKWWPAHAPMLP